MPDKAPPLDLAIRTEACGCEVMSTIDEELWIEFCSLHEAAADLLVACEANTTYQEHYATCSVAQTSMGCVVCDALLDVAVTMTETAIAKAKGKTK